MTTQAVSSAGDQLEVPEIGIGVHPSLPKRHKPTTRLSHFEGRQEELLERVRQSLQHGRKRNGRYEGSLIVEIAPAGVFCRVGEECRAQEGYIKPEAVHAEVVLHTPALVKKLGESAHRRCMVETDGIQYLVVAVHGWQSPSPRQQIGSA